MENNMNYAMYAGFVGYANENGIEKAAQYAKSLGFSSVEFLADASNPGLIEFAYDIPSAKHTKEVLDAAGLTVACHSVFAHVKKHPNVKEGLIKQAEIAAELGCPFLHHTLLTELFSAEPVTDYQESIDMALEVAIPVANRAAELGVTCIFEDQGVYVNGIEGFGGFYNELKRNCKNVGVCADFGNSLFVNVPAEEFMAAYIDDVVHVHIKDYRRVNSPTSPGKTWYPTPDNWWLEDSMVGHGVVNFESCMNLLKKINYQGAYALELCHTEPFELGVRQAMTYLEQFI